MPIAKDFGNELRKARENRGLTQKQLGELMDIGYHRILAYEKSGRVTLDLAERLAQVLGVSVWDLLKPPAREHDLNECIRRVSEAAKSAGKG